MYKKVKKFYSILDISLNTGYILLMSCCFV